MTVQCWKNQPIDKHFWAFVYYCKKQGDLVYYRFYPITQENPESRADLFVEKKSENKSS